MIQNVLVEHNTESKDIIIDNSSQIKYTLLVEENEGAASTIVFESTITDVHQILIEDTDESPIDIVITVGFFDGNVNLPTPSSNGLILAGDTDGSLYWVAQYTHPSLAAVSLNAVTGQVIDTLTSNTDGHVTGATLRYLAAADIPNLPISKITGLQTELDNRYTETELQTSGSSSVHWDNITNTPTTETGYGITDGFTSWDFDYNDLINTPSIAYANTIGIGDLDDVDTTGILNDKILKYNSTSGNWEVADDDDTTYVSSDFDHNSLINTHNLTTDIDHTSISNIGSNTHIQIDTHIADSTKHFTNPLTTKGDVWVYGSGSTRLPVGTDGYVLTADSLEVTGLKWTAISGGGTPGGSSGDIQFNNSGSFGGSQFAQISGTQQYRLEYNGVSYYVGYNCGSLNASGSGNVAIGRNNLWQLISGDEYNTAIGYNAGYSLTSASGCVFLGNEAGYYETGSDKLFIDNQSRTNEATSRISSLIYGEFNSTPASQLLRINSQIQFPKIAIKSAEVAMLYYNPANGDVVYGAAPTFTTPGFEDVSDQDNTYNKAATNNAAYTALDIDIDIYGGASTSSDTILDSLIGYSAIGDTYGTTIGNYNKITVNYINAASTKTFRTIGTRNIIALNSIATTSVSATANATEIIGVYGELTGTLNISSGSNLDYLAAGVFIDNNAGNHPSYALYTDGKVMMKNLPTSDPTNAGQLWNDSGTLKVSAG